MSPREQHQIRQEREHLEAQKRKVERMEAHERRMKKQHEDAARAKADRARQTIHRVTKWPGQDAHNQQGKIPTLVWYNSEKKAVAFGAEAQLHTTEEQAEDHGWFLAKHFKLHLHPEDMQSKYALKLDALPPGVGLQQIYSDFLEYLLKHTKIYFEDRMLDGKKMWEKYGPEMEVVIAHPNGWGIREQTFLRSAAVAAGFAMASKVRFVTEAEASVHFCIHHTNLGGVLRPGTNFAVCDAGGSTVDTTLYSVASISPTLKLEEKRASACVQAGAIFIDFEMERYLKSVLTKAELDPEDIEIYTKTGVKDFETFAKRVFRDEKTEHSILLAHSRFSNTTISTRRGRMTVPGSTIQKFFDTCVDEIKKSVDRQLDGLDVPYILLVGGFGDSEYVRNEFRKRYEPNGSRITLGNDSSSKAVADGATIWGIASSVVSRAPRYSFGKKTSRDYDPLLHDPQGRKAYVSLDGKYRVSGGWSEIVHKGITVDSEAICSEIYSRIYDTPSPQLNNVQVQLMAYTGDDRPEWMKDSFGRTFNSFKNVCTLSGNLNNLRGALKAKKSPLGVRYWKLKYQVCIRFGGTELESYLEWRENGVTRTGPVSIIVPPDASYGY
ncbi:hypothetical protein RhiXN_09274 [Rhizoctonia solani]|uniref:Heat shock 70 kDa protein 12A n=1 Tax=Rhizoctonia solani TaxID=456999 RepID=A0A8H8NUU0_9AGAM|nr:uncharacterized protein RhiXN_09274 [Rhizoctonia solani]QRW20299.1 hypothetical protein RhiXN_09274 [Rhizoctonia solani]